MNDNNSQKIFSIIGVGNLLMSDEGFGCHLINFLQKRYVFPKNVKLIDAGTAGIYMAPHLEACNHAIFVDTLILKDKRPGQILVFSIDDLWAKNLQTSLSPHQIGVLEVIEICKLRGKLPEKIKFIGVIPEKIEPGVELTPKLENSLESCANLVVEMLEKEGVEIKIA